MDNTVASESINVKLSDTCIIILDNNGIQLNYTGVSTIPMSLIL